ncbi:MAG: PPC domain-containing protein, partial [Nitrososphaerales archaeon]
MLSREVWRNALMICLFVVLVGGGLVQQPVFGQPGTSFANAAVISAGTYTYIIHSSANHFYKFEASRGQSVAITLTMQSSDLNLYLYNDAQ